MKLLLLDTNVSSYPIYSALKKDKNDVYVCGANPDDFLAKFDRNKYINVDYSNVEFLIKNIKKYKFDYILPGCNDKSYETASELYAKNISKLNVDEKEVISILINKKKFREYALSKGLPVPKIIDEANLLGYKGEIIVKPVDAYSGRGVTYIDKIDLESVNKAFSVAKKYSLSKKYIVEEYVSGQLYSHSAFIKDNKVIVDFIVEEYGLANQFVVDTSYVKFDFDLSVRKKLNEIIEYISSDLGLKDGLVHTQFIYNENKFWLIEITRRSPGDLYSKLIEYSTGFQYAKFYANAHIGRIGEVLEMTNNMFKKNILRHTITTNKPIIFTSINFKHDLKILSYISMAKSGDFVDVSPFGRVGILFSNCDCYEQMVSVKDMILQKRLYSIED